MEADEVIVEEVIHKALIRAAEKARDIGGIHIASVKELFGKQVGRKINLPYGVKAYRDYSGVKLVKNKEVVSGFDKKTALPELRLTLLETGEISDILITENKIELTFNDGSVKILYKTVVSNGLIMIKYLIMFFYVIERMVTILLFLMKVQEKTKKVFYRQQGSFRKERQHTACGSR